MTTLPSAVPSAQIYASCTKAMKDLATSHPENSQSQDIMAATTTMTMAGPARSPERTTTNSTQSGMLARPPPSFYLTIDGLLKSHASENTEIPLVGYPAAGVDDYEVHTAKAIDRYVDAACWWYQQNGLSVAVS